ncbi:MAG: SDR family oxidoreductase [Chloroflexi bacterium]|nr:SDR family oxidoreductase [Chloroflexota bacterium]
MDKLLPNRTAVVTGAGRGIGQGIALVLAREGADVAIGDIDLGNAEATAKQVRDMGRKAIAVQSDVGTRDGADMLIAEALKAFREIDILVNNAGVVGAKGWQQRPVPNDDDWNEVIRVNLMSRVYVSDAVMPHMKERRSGRIINIASIGGLQGGAIIPHYAATKAADISYTQSLAAIMAPYNVTVNAILPGLTFTTMLRGIYEQRTLLNRDQAEMTPEEILKLSESRTPLGRQQTPDDIGNAIAFLCSDYAKNVTALGLDVDAGMRMH